MGRYLSVNDIRGRLACVTGPARVPANLRRLIKVLLWSAIAYPLLLILMSCTTDVLFPNGAGLNRNVDWSRRSRGDLYLPNGEIVARDVRRLCWNETAVSGWEEPEGFVWLGPGHEVIYASGPQYMAALEASGLGGLTGPCQGFYSIRMDAEMLLGHWESVWPQD